MVRAFAGSAAGVAASLVLAQAAALPPVTLPAAYQNAPPDALAGKPRDAALGEPALARLIELALVLNSARPPEKAQVQASGVRVDAGVDGAVDVRVAGGTAASHQQHPRGSARDPFATREDRQLAQEVACAWFDGRAADARLGIARVTDALAAQSLQLVNQRVAAGLATLADLESSHAAAIKSTALAGRARAQRSAAVARLATLTGTRVANFAPNGDATRFASAPAETAHTGSASASAAALPYPIRLGTPAALLERPDVRAARLRLEGVGGNRDHDQSAAFYRDTVARALEEVDNAYAAAVQARTQRSTASDLAASASRQAAAVLALVEAGRVGRIPHIETQLLVQDARLQLVDADAAYACALVALERVLGPD